MEISMHSYVYFLFSRIAKRTHSSEQTSFLAPSFLPDDFSRIVTRLIFRSRQRFSRFLYVLFNPIGHTRDLRSYRASLAPSSHLLMLAPLCRIESQHLIVVSRSIRVTRCVAETTSSHFANVSTR